MDSDSMGRGDLSRSVRLAGVPKKSAGSSLNMKGQATKVRRTRAQWCRLTRSGSYETIPSAMCSDQLDVDFGPPLGRAVTIADVARQAGVSHQTVSNALNGRRHSMSAETYRRVVAAMDQLGY